MILRGLRFARLFTGFPRAYLSSCLQGLSLEMFRVQDRALGLQELVFCEFRGCTGLVGSRCLRAKGMLR